MSNPSGLTALAHAAKRWHRHASRSDRYTDQWLGLHWLMGAGCSGNANNRTFSMLQASNDGRQPSLLAGTMVSPDVDASNTPTQDCDAGSDGMMPLRYPFGYSAGAITADAQRGDSNGRLPGDTVAYIDLIKPTLDIDGDGRF